MAEKYARININDAVKAFRENANSVLLDVREVDEYAEKHILGSVNVPLSTIEKVAEVIKDKHTLVYVHCRSGVRSIKASDAMIEMGYDNLIEAGGIIDFVGETQSNK